MFAQHTALKMRICGNIIVISASPLNVGFRILLKLLRKKYSPRSPKSLPSHRIGRACLKMKSMQRKTAEKWRKTEFLNLDSAILEVRLQWIYFSVTQVNT